MTVVSDTSPLHYLLLIDHLPVLPSLFEQVILPQAVYEELNHAHAPEVVRAWVSALPEWVTVHSAAPLESPLGLGRGEREAIPLAEQLKADALLMDDWKAGKFAQARGLVVIGTLSVLEIASQRGLIDLAEAYGRLQKTTFHVTPSLLQSILDRQPK